MAGDWCNNLIIIKSEGKIMLCLYENDKGGGTQKHKNIRQIQPMVGIWYTFVDKEAFFRCMMHARREGEHGVVMDGGIGISVVC